MLTDNVDTSFMAALFAALRNAAIFLGRTLTQKSYVEISNRAFEMMRDGSACARPFAAFSPDLRKGVPVEMGYVHQLLQKRGGKEKK